MLHFQSFLTDITYLELASKKILNNISPDKEAVKNIRSLLNEPESGEMSAIISYLRDLNLNIEAESVDEDPDWFVDLPKNLKTKEAVLRKSARERIRSYLNTSKDFINSSVSV